MSVINETRYEVRLYNFLKSKFGGDHSNYFSVDQLTEKAIKRSKLDDFGSTDFIEGLNKLCYTLNHEAKLHAFGRGLAQATIIKLLTNRLEIQQRLKEDSQILSRKISRPIFIVGSPRTGTTLLFNLLSLDERRQWLQTWRASRPGMPQNNKAEQQKTYRQCRDAIRYINYMRPDFKYIHETGVDLPDECIPLLSSSFTCKIFNTQYAGDSYLEWFEAQDLTETYSYYANQLRLIQGENPKNKSWLLKSPIHLSALSYIHKTFPDAIIIQTHRTPKEFIPSNTNLRYAFRALSSYAVDRKELSRSVIRDQVRSLEIAINDRNNHPLNVVDVYYQDLIKDPVAVIEKIYAAANESQPPNLDASIKNYLASNPQHKHGVHKYSLAELDLSDKDVTDAFEFYEEGMKNFQGEESSTLVSRNRPKVKFA